VLVLRKQRILIEPNFDEQGVRPVAERFDMIAWYRLVKTGI
jgi:hypothetical protein